MEEDISRFSVIKSNFKIFEEDNVKYILKEINPTTLNKMIGQVKDFTLEYISRLKSSGIPFPGIKEYYIEDNKIFFVCNYMGENLFKLIIEKDPKDLIKKNEILLQIFNIFKKAKEANLDIDPHPKNFVLEGNKIYYVDFSPPYLPEYNKLVINNIAEKYRGLAKRNFAAFSPSELGYHFAGDLLKENNEFEKIMPNLYSYLKQEEIIDGSFEKFIKRANEIKKIELERVRRKVFLI